MQTSFTLGPAQGDHIAIHAYAYERTPSGEFYDDNWLSCEVDIRAGAFAGRYPASVLTADFDDLRQDLERLHRDLQGTASFEPMEHPLRIDFRCDGLGHVHATGIAMDQPGQGQALHFSLSFDQTELGEALVGLQSIMQAFPVRA